MTPSTDTPSAAGVTQLLPCPFCGSPAKHEDYGRGRAAVSCTGCLIRTRLGCNDEDMSVEWNTRQQAIAQHEGGRGEPVVVTIGAGEIVSNWGTYHDIPAVLLQPTPDGPGEFGAKLDRDYPKDSVPPGTVVLQFKGPATVLLEDIAAAIGQANPPTHPPATRPAALAEDEVEALRQRAATAEHQLHSFRQVHAARGEQLRQFIKDRAPELWPDYAAVSVNSSIYSEDYTLEPVFDREINILRHRAEDAEKRATEAEARITQQAEEVARLRRIVKGWADWYRLADGDPDCEYLNGMGWNDAEALADMSLAALRALNEQPGGEGGHA